MSQHAYARALNLLTDVGVDPDDARYVMKRLSDYGYAVRERDPVTGGTSPPVSGPTHPAKAARKARRQSYLDQMRAEIEASKAAQAAELAQALKDEQARRAEEDRARERALAVAKVLDTMAG